MEKLPRRLRVVAATLALLAVPAAYPLAEGGNPETQSRPKAAVANAVNGGAVLAGLYKGVLYAVFPPQAALLGDTTLVGFYLSPPPGAKLLGARFTTPKLVMGFRSSSPIPLVFQFLDRKISGQGFRQVSRTTGKQVSRTTGKQVSRTTGKNEMRADYRRDLGLMSLRLQLVATNQYRATLDLSKLDGARAGTSSPAGAGGGPSGTAASGTGAGSGTGTAQITGDNTARNASGGTASAGDTTLTNRGERDARGTLGSTAAVGDGSGTGSNANPDAKKPVSGSTTTSQPLKAPDVSTGTSGATTSLPFSRATTGVPNGPGLEKPVTTRLGKLQVSVVPTAAKPSTGGTGFTLAPYPGAKGTTVNFNGDTLLVGYFVADDPGKNLAYYDKQMTAQGFQRVNAVESSVDRTVQTATYKRGQALAKLRLESTGNGGYRLSVDLSEVVNALNAGG